MSAIETFKANNIRIVEPNLASFRTAVMDEYRKTDAMKAWKPGLVERIDAVR